MGRKRKMPPQYGATAVRNAQRRYLKGKKTDGERAEKNREAAGHVISLCFMIALHDRYGIGKERLERVIASANGALDRFALAKQNMGMVRAKGQLGDELRGLLDENFVLPVTKSPKTRRDWLMLAEQREAAEIVVKCYALAARRALGFGAERLRETVRATEQVFRDFAEWAEGGDWFGYNMLARRMTEILGEPVEVDESGADEPVFSAELG